MIIQNPSIKEFNELTSTKPVVVDFWATWCSPCRVQGEIIEQLSKKRDDITIIKVDVDECDDLAVDFAVSAVPTLLCFKDGAVIEKFIGVTQLDQIEKVFN